MSVGSGAFIPWGSENHGFPLTRPVAQCRNALWQRVYYHAKLRMLRYVYMMICVILYIHCLAWQILYNPAFVQQYKQNHYYYYKHKKCWNVYCCSVVCDVEGGSKMWSTFIEILDEKDAAHSDLAHLAISLINKVRFAYMYWRCWYCFH